MISVLGVMLSIPLTRSMMIMRIYSEYNEKESLLSEKKIQLSIPGGGNWYPFVMTFCDNHGFSSWMDEELKLTILYNFPRFSWEQGTSLIYDPDSDYYNSFYGAYLVERTNGMPYGFDEEGNVVPDEIAEVTKFDFWRLVLEDIGMPKEMRCFEWEICEIEKNLQYVGDDGWTRISAKVKVNGMYHQPDEYAMSYLQYGKPKINRAVNEYEVTEMDGLIYGKHYEDLNVSVFFYCCQSGIFEYLL